MANDKPKYSVPKVIFARFDTDSGVLLAETNVEQFDDEGLVGRYVLEETGEVSIEKAFRRLITDPQVPVGAKPLGKKTLPND